MSVFRPRSITDRLAGFADTATADDNVESVQFPAPARRQVAI